SFTIRGLGFGATGQVTLDGALVLPTTSWSDTQIGVTVPAGTAVGPHQLRITAANGESTINGLTFHVLGSATTPFPATAVLDNFNRGNSNNLGGNWNGISVGYQIRDNALRVYAGAALSLPLWATSFGANQEAYFTFTDVSTTPGILGADTQGLILKRTSAPGIGNSNLIAVLYDYTNSSVLIYTQAGSLLTVTLQGTLSGVTFANGDRLGARALSNGAVEVYKNSTLIGSVNVTSGSTPWPTTLAQGGGQIGLRFTGTNGTGNAGPSAGDARIDNFGGGNVAASTGGSYTPHVYEVGPGKAYATIQSAIDAAQASNGNDLVVVYPGQPDLSNPRYNPRGAYYENLIINSPIKLQGVGPGGFQGATYVPGSIIDGGAFGGDGVVADNWYTTIGGITWDGNQEIYDGAVVSIFAHAAGSAAFTDSYKASIDGFDLRGGNQQGFPGNINEIGGLPTGQPANLITQGGAIFANGYARYLQI
ncbi:MAG: IPT/TIG domain-containing protein, partial [Caldilineaceae bacterium]|nr:IPT/TIG domain-containing protein [Caldilineaceae bacterium]